MSVVQKGRIYTYVDKQIVGEKEEPSTIGSKEGRSLLSQTVSVSLRLLA